MCLASTNSMTLTVHIHASRDEIVQAFSPSENTPTRNYNVTEHARVEEGEGMVSRLTQELKTSAPTKQSGPASSANALSLSC